MMKRSRELLKDHPVNKSRIERGLPPVSSVWFWGEGRKPNLTPFEEKIPRKRQRGFCGGLNKRNWNFCRFK